MKTLHMTSNWTRLEKENEKARNRFGCHDISSPLPPYYLLDIFYVTKFFLNTFGGIFHYQDTWTMITTVVSWPSHLPPSVFSKFEANSLVDVLKVLPPIPSLIYFIKQKLHLNFSVVIFRIRGTRRVVGIVVIFLTIIFSSETSNVLNWTGYYKRNG